MHVVYDIHGITAFPSRKHVALAVPCSVPVGIGGPRASDKKWLSDPLMDLWVGDLPLYPTQWSTLHYEMTSQPALLKCGRLLSQPPLE